MRKAQLLAQLQGLDTALDRAREREALVTQQLADRTALAAAEADDAEAARSLRGHQSELRDLELEVQDLRAKLAALEKKLYSGSVMNPKELGAMSDDARQLRKQISTREDRILELFDVVEAASNAAAEADRLLAAARERHERSQAELTAERDELRAKIAEHERERESLAARADARSLRTYESLRRTRGGLAVAVVAQRTCQGCRVSLPVNLEMRARSAEDLVLCQSCGRILYAGV